MNIFGNSIDNYHDGDTLIAGSLTVEEDLVVEGKIDYEGNIEIVPPASLLTDSIEAVTPAGVVFEDSSSAEIMRFNNARLQLETGLLTDQIRTKTVGATFEVQAPDGKRVIAAGPDLRLQTNAYSFPQFDGAAGTIMATDGKGDLYWEGITEGSLITQVFAGTIQNTSYPKFFYNPIESSAVGTNFISDSDFQVGSVIRLRACGVYNSTNVTFPAATLGFFRLDVMDVGFLTSEYKMGTQIQNTVTLRGYWQIQANLIRTSASVMRLTISYITSLDDNYNVRQVSPTPTGSVDLAYSGGGAYIDLKYSDESPLNLTQTPYFTSYTIDYKTSVGFPTATPLATTNHLALSNLTTGDSGHTQFALLAGRSGGQTLAGGTTVSQSLTLVSNLADGTTGTVSTPSPLLGLSYGFQTHPDSKMEIAGAGDLSFVKGGVEKLRISSAQATLNDDLVLNFDNPTITLVDTIAGGSGTLRITDAGGNSGTVINNSGSVGLYAEGGSNSVVCSHTSASGVTITADGKAAITCDSVINAFTSLNMKGSTIFGSDLAFGDLVLQSTTQATRGQIDIIDNTRVRKANPGFTLLGTTDGLSTYLLSNNNGAQSGSISLNSSELKLGGDSDHGYITINNSNGEMNFNTGDSKALIVDAKTFYAFREMNLQGNLIIGGDSKGGDLTLTTNSSGTPGSVLIDGGLRILTSEFKDGVSPLLSYFRQTGQGLVENTTSELTVIGTGVGTMTVPAGLIQLGSMVSLNNRGVVSALGAASVLTVRLKINGVTNVSATVTFSSAVSLVFYEIDIMFVCKSIGASGTMQAIGFFRYGNNSFPLGLAALTNINTTIDNTVDITVQWNVANASNRISSQMCSIKNA